MAALGRVAMNSIFSCLLKKPNKPKKAKDVKLQQSTTKEVEGFGLKTVRSPEAWPASVPGNILGGFKREVPGQGSFW